ncbi:LysR family transcriptional regulator [Variovorax robiniae]|uniref:LysR family transcriptional regulator n=1 Tax=Variovorax robiniae TaxID=1836199 RepID=A0ABU8XFW2_9BURK
MTPRQLRYFVEIARAGNISQAAATLHIAQPALSQHMSAIERELGRPLFERHARGVTLTPAGRRLFDRASAILRQLELLPDEVAAATGTPQGEVRLCIASAVAGALVVPLYRLMEAQYPQVRLSLQTGASLQARQLVETRRIDLALMPNAFELPGLECDPVYEEQFALFGAQGSFPAELERMAFADIGARPLVTLGRDHDLRKLIERVALALQCPLNVRYEFNEPELIRPVVREGLAFALLPRNAFLAVAAPHDEVQSVPIEEPALARVQSIVWPAGAPLTPAAEAARQALRDTISHLLEAGTLQGRWLGA